MTEFEAFALDHGKHRHCAGCNGCILDPRDFVQATHPLWCVGCRDRIDQSTPAALPRPWAKGWVIGDGSDGDRTT